MEAIERHARTGAGDVKRLKGQSNGNLRLRVGNWRVFFVYDSNDRIIVINRVAHRAQAY